MKHISLATRYRPQRFDEIAGQDLIKAVLSKAVVEDRIAPGYLFSGTRGVGKTTIARIFAKALNCEHAPQAEPCNECSACRRITAGAYPDVVELDGASNNKVDDVRELREKVGFFPLEGRYKIFIIDEAHMLTQQAFNAFLKTLEEPPAHVVFIFATTELHKFPVTILSRCQVYSFQHIKEETLVAHLKKILSLENIPYDEEAVRLIAHRGAGSARDSMSLLDQVLSYSSGRLATETTRAVLGIAGQDILERIFNALVSGSCVDMALVTRDLVSTAIDIGFFVRELTDQIRSLFLLRTSDKDAVARLGITEDELNFLMRIAPQFSPAFLHAAWQMILEAQRGIAISPNPATALEMLLVNLAMLPRLLPAAMVGKLDGASGISPAGMQSGSPQGMPAQHSAAQAQPAPQQARPQAPAQQAQGYAGGQSRQPAGTASQTMPQTPRTNAAAAPAASPVQTRQAAAPETRSPASSPAAPQAAPAQAAPVQPAAAPQAQHSERGQAADTAQTAAAAPSAPVRPQAAPKPAAAPQPEKPAESLDMAKFTAWVGTLEKAPIATHLLSGFSCTEQTAGRVVLEGGGVHQTNCLQKALPDLERLLSQYLKRPVKAELRASQSAMQHAGSAPAQTNFNRPELKYCFEILNAHVDHCHRI